MLELLLDIAGNFNKSYVIKVKQYVHLCSISKFIGWSQFHSKYQLVSKLWTP